jgi:drug/metabolite transporter (DMT)-like permease
MSSTTLPADAAARLATERDTLAGLACGLGAGALWGFVFVAPKLAGDFNPLFLAAGRYLCYGLTALALLAPRWREVGSQLERRHWRELTALAFVGNTLHFVLLAIAVQQGGVAMAALVIGFLPITVTLVGSREQGSVPLRRLAPSLLLCAAGAVCIGWQSLGSAPSGSLGQQAFALACAVGALLAWTAFAVGNTRCLARVTVSAQDWNLLTGLVTGAQSLLLLPIAILLDPGSHGSADWLRLGGVCLALALVASIFGNALWNRMSRLLPLTLVGQMILFQTVFALLYGFAWEQRLPTWLEVSALVLLAASVFSCLGAHRAHRPGNMAT